MKPRYLLPADLLGPAEVLELLPVSKMTLSRWRRAGTFPEPWRELQTGPVWILADIEGWWRRRQEPGT